MDSSLAAIHLPYNGHHTYMSSLVPSERFVAAAVACDAFLFMMPLFCEEILQAFRVAATRLADIRRVIFHAYVAGEMNERALKDAEDMCSPCK